MITQEENFKIEKIEKGEFKPLPADVYTVELLDISVKNQHTYATRGLPEDQQEFEKTFNLQFTLLEGKEKGESLRGRNLWENFIPTTLWTSKKSGKNKLIRIIEAFQGHDITPEQEATFEAISLNNLVGKQIRVVVEQTQKGDNVYNKIASFLPANTQLPSLTAEEKDKATVKNKKEDDMNLDEMVEAMEHVNDIAF